MRGVGGDLLASAESISASVESFGAAVVKVPGSQLLDAVATCIDDEQRILVHPFDDVDLIRGHASCGLEILEDLPEVVRAPRARARARCREPCAPADSATP